MIIYIDTSDDYKCHVSDDTGTMLEYENSFFDDKCKTFIEGYRCVPRGYTWTREDGVVFEGEMVSPWTNYAKLERAQFDYKIEKLETQNTEYESALNEYESALTEIEQALGL